MRSTLHGAADCVLMDHDAHLRWCRAEAAFRKAIELEPYEKSYEQLGKVLIMQERPNDALTVYMQSLQLTPDNADILCQIGLLHLRQGKFRKRSNTRFFQLPQGCIWSV